MLPRLKSVAVGVARNQAFRVAERYSINGRHPIYTQNAAEFMQLEPQ
jgi:hypothetical protein